MSSALLALAFQSNTMAGDGGDSRTRADKSAAGASSTVVTLPTDEVLAGRVRLGDREAFDILLERYHLRLIGVAEAALGDLAEAEDLVQEILLQVWINRAEWEPKYGAAVYLFGSVTNRVRDVWRNRKRAERSLKLYRNEIDEAGSTSALAERIAEVWDEVALLPERWRKALLLRYLYDFPFAEVGKTMRVSENAAKKLVQRAISALTSSFSKETEQNI